MQDRDYAQYSYIILSMMEDTDQKETISISFGNEEGILNQLGKIGRYDPEIHSLGDKIQFEFARRITGRRLSSQILTEEWFAVILYTQRNQPKEDFVKTLKDQAIFTNVVEAISRDPVFNSQAETKWIQTISQLQIEEQIEELAS